MIILLDKCFECGLPMEEMHHVVPKSKGGTKTIPLCATCHGKVHDIKNRTLAAIGRAKAKERDIANGVIFGRKNGSYEKLEMFLSKHKDVIKLLSEGLSIRKISKITSKSTTTIHKVKIFTSDTQI